MSWVVILIPLFPLLGFLVLGAGYRIIPKKLTSYIGPGTVLLSFISTIIVFFQFRFSLFAISPFHYFTWLSFGKFSIPFDFLIDPLSLLMMLIVTGVGFIIHVFSVGYMGHDKGFNRFFAYMNLFIFSMLILVMGANYVVMFMGWEGVGLCSYLLIGFWFRNHDFNNAAKKAFIMNRIGDLGFILGIFLIFTTFGSFGYNQVFDLARTMNTGNGTLTAITLLLFVGATGKSAQIPLHTWLPDAMAGPTPVSALIHAATMVTAGVYMVARSGVLYVLSPLTMDVIGIGALATMLFAAAIAIFQNDIKKILAWSTISQLGYMFLALSLGAFTASVFHLMTHAFFKALLFLGAGSLIHALEGEQDIRNMGGLKNKLPKTYRTFLIGTLAIAGLPPLSGFFSKDEILAAAFAGSLSIWIVAAGTTMMTAFYMFRLHFLTFSGTYRGSHPKSETLHESPLVMTIPLILLAVLAIAGGFLNIPEFMGGKGMLKEFMAPVFADALKLQQSQPRQAGIALEWTNMTVVLILVLIMIFAAYRRYVKNPETVKREEGTGNFIRRLAAGRFYIDELYDNVFVKPSFRFSKWLHDFAEARIIDRTVNGTGTLISGLSDIFRFLQTGHVGTYLFFMILGILLILFFNIIL